MNKSKILVVDDDEPVRCFLARLFQGSPSYSVVTADDGEKGLELAGDVPDLILLDVNMPKRNGWEVLSALRRDPRTRLIPVILLTGAGDIEDKVGGLSRGADDYVTKPFATAELLARVDGLLRRTRLALTANPLTGLPGSPAIEEEVTRRIKENAAFAFFHIDLDRFKAYNDAYGYARGDEVIRAAAEIIRAAVGEGFAGHVGGDDFVAITELDEAACVAQRLVAEFDARVPAFYSIEDRARGYLESVDRAGRRRRVPLLTLSAGIATTARRSFSCYAEVVAVAGEMKAYLKADDERALSCFAFDRRAGSAHGPDSKPLG